MPLHVEYECNYVFVSFKFFSIILLVFEAVDLDDPIGLSLSRYRSLKPFATFFSF